MRVVQKVHSLVNAFDTLSVFSLLVTTLMGMLCLGSFLPHNVLAFSHYCGKQIWHEHGKPQSASFYQVL